MGWHMIMSPFQQLDAVMCFNPAAPGVFIQLWVCLYKNYDNDSTFNVGGDGCQGSKKLLIMIL